MLNMTSNMILEEKERLLLKIPPTVNIEVVEDSEDDSEEEETDIPEISNILPR